MGYIGWFGHTEFVFLPKTGFVTYIFFNFAKDHIKDLVFTHHTFNLGGLVKSGHEKIYHMAFEMSYLICVFYRLEAKKRNFRS